MPDNNMTIVHDGAWGSSSSHRRLSVTKVENGFVMKAMVSVPEEIENSVTHRVKTRHRAEERQYVYYSVEELLSAVEGYLTAKKEEIRGEGEE